MSISRSWNSSIVSNPLGTSSCLVVCRRSFSERALMALGWKWAPSIASYTASPSCSRWGSTH